VIRRVAIRLVIAALFTFLLTLVANPPVHALQGQSWDFPADDEADQAGRRTSKIKPQTWRCSLRLPRWPS